MSLKLIGDGPTVTVDRASVEALIEDYRAAFAEIERLRLPHRLRARERSH